MAAVTKVAVRPVRVLDADIGKASADLSTGDPVVIDAAAGADARYPCSYKAAVAEGFIHGVVLKDAVSGGPVEVMKNGEFDGYSGLTPGNKLTVAAGSIDSTVGTAENPQLYASSATRIRVRI